MLTSLILHCNSSSSLSIVSFSARAISNSTSDSKIIMKQIGVQYMLKKEIIGEKKKKKKDNQA